MKRLCIAVVAGLCVGAPARAQNGTLAPTVPVVPAPVLSNGSAVTPAGGPLSNVRTFAQTVWSPVRSPVVPSSAPYTGAAPVVTAPMAPAPFGPAGCGTTGCERGGFNWTRLKTWLCFRYTPTELPKMRPNPYTTPLQGLFSCSSGAGCAPCAANGQPVAAPNVVPQPQPQLPPAPLPMPAPMKPPGAGAVMLPSRGTQGAPPPTAWQTAPGQSEFGTAAKTTANPPQQLPQGRVVNTGYLPLPK